MIPSEIERRIRDADMVPVGTELADEAWSESELLERVDAIIAGVEAPRSAQPTPMGPRSLRLRRGWVIAAAAAIVVMIPAVAAVLLARSDPKPTDPATEPTALVEQLDPDSLPYASFPDGRVLHGGSWAVIVFYRPPNCIPPLVDLIHPPEATAVEDCGPPTVSGIEAGNGVTEYTGLGAVPAWFAPWPVVEHLSADGDLTRRELASMQTRVEGSADAFQGRLGPDVAEFQGSGELVDGTPFSFAGSPGTLVTSLPAAFEQATVQSLEGLWENGLNRIDFRDDGSLAIDRTRAIGSAPPAGISGGSFEIDAGLLTITEEELHDCQVDSVTADHYSFTYSAVIDVESGRLILELVSDDCAKRTAGFSEPYSRVG